MEFNPYPNLETELWLLVQPEIKHRAEKVADLARRIAPVRTGRYRDSIQVFRRSRGYRVQANVSYAEFVEFGTSKMRAYRTLKIASTEAK